MPTKLVTYNSQNYAGTLGSDLVSSLWNDASSVKFMSDNESKILVNILGILSAFSTVKVD